MLWGEELLEAPVFSELQLAVPVRLEPVSAPIPSLLPANSTPKIAISGEVSLACARASLTLHAVPTISNPRGQERCREMLRSGDRLLRLILSPASKRSSCEFPYRDLMVVRPTAAPIWAAVSRLEGGGTTNGTGQKQGENMAAPFEGHCQPLAQDN
jgi:hypothetical protein